MKYFIGVLCLLVGLKLNASEGKPNIILIMADDLGYETLSCYGNEYNRTPNLDALASGGMRFDYCYSTPLCTPSRVQLMTGKYSNRNYIGFGLLDPKEKTFGHMMQENGYKTCIVGKWQLFGNEKQFALAGGKKGTLPQDAGFDNFLLWQVDTLGSRYKNPTVYTDERKSVTLDGQYGEDVFAAYLENFIAENKDGPFFAYYPMCLPHDPFVPTPFSKDFERIQPGQKVNDPQYFKDMVEYMDYIVGRIVKKVEDLGIREETIIIFTGDNGTSPRITSLFNGKQYQGNKGRSTERGTHVPLIVSWKGTIKSESINTSLVDFTDFMPTLLDAANSDNVPTQTQDGLSFFPQLKNDYSKKRKWVYGYYDPNWGSYTLKNYIHNKEWKLYSDGKIFRISEDPDEQHPLNKGQLDVKSLAIIKSFEKVLADKKRL